MNIIALLMIVIFTANLKSTIDCIHTTGGQRPYCCNCSDTALLYKSRTPVLTQGYTGQVRVLTSGVVFSVGIPGTTTMAIY